MAMVLLAPLSGGGGGVACSIHTRGAGFYLAPHGAGIVGHQKEQEIVGSWGGEPGRLDIWGGQEQPRMSGHVDVKVCRSQSQSIKPGRGLLL